MSNNVWPVDIQYNLTHSIVYQTYVADMGDGFEQRVNKNLSFNRADGEGNVSGYKGINKFTITVKNAQHVNYSGGNRTPATAIWNFYKARTGSLDSFYFYNPIEAPIDPTGNNTIGRYRVRFADPELSREAFVLKLFNFGINLIEVRD